MKLQVSLKNLKKLRRSQNQDIDDIITTLTNNYYTDLVKYQEDLLLNICKDNNLCYEDLHVKYIKSFKKNMKINKNNNLIDISDSESDNDGNNLQNTNTASNNNINILEKIKIKDNTYYIENKEGGIIYNSEVIKIGEIKNGNYFIYE